MRYMFHSHHMFHSFYLFHLYVFCMKMVEIPSLYELACRAYNCTDIEGYQEAFDEAMTSGEKPCLILMKIRSGVNRFTYEGEDQNYEIQNPFCWRVVYVDESRFGMQGTLIGPNRRVSQAAVLEDSIPPSWAHSDRPPKMRGGHQYLLYNLDQERDVNPTRTYFPRCLYAREILEVFMRLNEPVYHDIPIEAVWFEDAQLPLEVIDGVPESPQHCRVRNRFEDEYGKIYPMWGYERFYLDDPYWDYHLREAYQRNEGEPMEE